MTTKPQLLEQSPSEMISRKRKPSWACEVTEEEKRHGVPEGTIRERKKPKSYPSYMALMSDLVHKEPTCFEEATKQKEWVDAMIEEYQSIIKNDVGNSTKTKRQVSGILKMDLQNKALSRW